MYVLYITVTKQFLSETINMFSYENVIDRTSIILFLGSFCSTSYQYCIYSKVQQYKAVKCDRQKPWKRTVYEYIDNVLIQYY